jgi:hypothetical protein
MSLLSDYRLRIKSLLSADVEQTLLKEGVAPHIAVRIAGSRAVIAQASVVRRVVKRNDAVVDPLHEPEDEREPNE